MYLVNNSIIERFNINGNPQDVIRILWISSDEKHVVVIDVSNERKKRLPFFIDYENLIEEIESKMSRVLELEIDMQLLSPDESYLDKYRENRDRRWNLIKEIVKREPEIYLPEQRGKMISEVSLETGISKKVIRGYLLKYWFYGKSINGLLDNYFSCGVPRENRIFKVKSGPVTSNRHLITDDDIEIFEKAIRLFHKRQGMSIKTTHERMCETYYKRGYYRKYGVRVPIIDSDKAPTLRQFRYWYGKNSTHFSRYANKHGKRRATIDVRPFLGNASERASCVGALYEIDATRPDVLLVSYDRETILGKPVLYIVIDVFSRLITGFHVSLAPESWLEAMLAMENAAINKVKFCKKYEIDITEDEWPCQALPKYLVADRGELKAQFSERFVNLEIDVLNAPSYRGDLKPFVESRFHITNRIIRELLPGSTPAQPKVRGDQDPARESALTIEEFNKFLIVFFITYNKSAVSADFSPTKEMFTENVELTPLKIWLWSKGKRLLHEKTRNELRHNLYPRDKAKVTRFGIVFKDLFYTCDRGVKEGWFEGEGNIDGQKYIEISFDPRNCSNIYFKYKKEFIPCRLTGRSQEYEGLHFNEVEKIMEYRDKQIKQQEANEKQHNAELHAFSDKLVKTATKITKEAVSDQSFYSRQKNKREKRESDSKSWGAKSAAGTNQQQVTETTDHQNVILFESPEGSEELSESTFTRNIQELFSAKNKSRRWKSLDD